MAKAKKDKKNVVGITQMRAMTADELSTLSLDLHKEVFNLSMQLKTNQLQNTAQLRVAKRNIARAKTLLNEKKSSETSDDKQTN